LARFDTTRWSVIHAAGSSDPEKAREALSYLFQSYWYPVYAMVRRYGHDAADAEDLTQEYFTRALEKGFFRELRPEHGRFRSFLLVSVRNFLHNERDRERAAKRGGGKPKISLDGAAAEQRYSLEPVESETPETLFERAWASEVLARALARLEEESQEGEEGSRFAQLRPHLTGDEDAVGYRELATSWGVGESAVRVAVHRLRKRFGAVLRDEIAGTVADPADVGEELRHLLAAVGVRGGSTPGGRGGAPPSGSG